MGKKMMTIWMVVLAALMTGNVMAALDGYTASPASSVVYYTNFETGEQTPIGGPSSIPYIYTLEYSFFDETLYAASSNDLYSIDSSSGLGTLIKSNITESDINSLDSAPDGSLYATLRNNDFCRIDPLSGTSTLISSFYPTYFARTFTVINETTAIAWDRDDGWLFEVDLTDGSTTSLGYFEGPFEALEFGPDGMLYAWYVDNFFSLDVESMTSTYLQSFSVSGHSMTIIPEPATLLLFGLGAVVLKRKR